MTQEPHDIRVKRLKYQAWHRGTKEMDLILGRYFDAYGASLTSAQLDEFEAILELPDDEMFAWVSGRKPMPEQHNSTIWQAVLKSLPQ